MTNDTPAKIRHRDEAIKDLGGKADSMAGQEATTFLLDTFLSLIATLKLLFIRRRP